MATVLLLPLVVLVLLALSPGGVPAPTLAQDCPIADVVVKEGRKQLIEGKEDERSISVHDLYVKPQPGFEGMVLTVGEQGENYSAWFPAEPECFPNNTEWYKVGFGTVVNNDTNTIVFIFHVRGCVRGCKMTNASLSVQGTSVVAYGPSLWLLEQPPSSCDYKGWISSSFPSTPTCRNPPLPTTPLPVAVAKTLGTTVSTTVVVMAVLVLLVVAAVVVLFRRRRQQQQSATSATGQPASQPPTAEPANELLIMENEVYDPLV